jgi:folate-binding protein YgfZ
MVSNEVEALRSARRARRFSDAQGTGRGDDDRLASSRRRVLLLTGPEAGERLARELLRSRFAAKCEIALEEHRSVVVLGEDELVLNHHKGALPNRDYGVPAVELIDAAGPPEAERIGEEELERLRILARTPRLGRELDDRVLPAEAGLEERAISFTKGCYPGQEPVARLHYRGHPNRGLRVLVIDGAELPAADAVLTFDDRDVGRVTSAIAEGDEVLALAYVRREVPEDAHLRLGHRSVRHATSASAGQPSLT